jgi:colanic acid biosynthesis glycosyl transferase WcaI
VRLLIVGLNYLPESTSIGPYTAELAEYLRGRGHEVQVITGFPMAPQWGVWAPYRGRWWMREAVNGVPVLRTYLYVPRQPAGALKRILFDTSFAVSSLLGGLASGRRDLIVAVSPPLQVGLTAWLLGVVTGASFLLHVQDLMPDMAIAAGLLKDGGVSARLARGLERFVYRRARGIGVICEGFARNLAGKGVPADRVVVLPDFLDLGFIRPLDRDNEFRQWHNIGPGEFVVMYSGSIALKQGLQTFVEAAAAFGESDGVSFYLVGEGPYLPDLEQRAAGVRAARLRFLPLQPRDGLPAQLAAANALVITQRRGITDMVFPGKLLYYMASGRPIVAAVSADSETGRFVAGHDVGLVVPTEEPGELAGAIRFLRDNPEEAERLGRNGRRVAEERFDRRIVLKQFAEHLEGLAVRSGRASVRGGEAKA